jgi:aspartyl-tRNA(Asn)/glutamyl-tRNA(Gln) amidotransferase subunit A
MSKTKPAWQSFADIRTAAEAGRLRYEALVAHYLERIAATKELNIYVEVFEEEALARARALDARREQGLRTGRLAGMVISIKDVICYKDHGVTAGSRILSGFRSLYTATALERLLQEDAIVIGRTNCDEFAMGSANEHSAYGPTRNAADPARVPGGSSGGAAVSVQADTCLLALGSDTGGSVRQPAAFCGVYGFKPTYGRISRHGLLAYGSSFDQIGLLAHTVEDIATALSVMAGPDAYDSTASRRPVEAYEAANWREPARIAYFSGILDMPGMDAGIRDQARAFLADCGAAGHVVEAVSFPLLDYVIPAYYVMTTAEASSNLARYDGVRYGYRSQEVYNLDETYKKTRTEGFGTEVKRRILLGSFVLSSGYYDAYYGKAQRVRRLIREQLLAIFETYDFIFLPASPIQPWLIGQKVNDPVASYLADIFTVLANLAGLPAIAIPHKQGSEDLLPMGIQLMAAPFREADLLAFSRLLDQQGLPK